MFETVSFISAHLNHLILESFSSRSHGTRPQNGCGASRPRLPRSGRGVLRVPHRHSAVAEAGPGPRRLRHGLPVCPPPGAAAILTGLPGGGAKCTGRPTANRQPLSPPPTRSPIPPPGRGTGLVMASAGPVLFLTQPLLAPYLVQRWGARRAWTAQAAGWAALLWLSPFATQVGWRCGGGGAMVSRCVGPFSSFNCLSSVWIGFFSKHTLLICLRHEQRALLPSPCTFLATVKSILLTLAIENSLVNFNCCWVFVPANSKPPVTRPFKRTAATHSLSFIL